MADQKDLAVEAAKMAIKQAARKALMSAAATVAPYVGAGCAIILGVFLIVVLACLLASISLYSICNYAPKSLSVLSWFAGFAPSSWTKAQMIAGLGQLCDIFKEIK